MVGAGRTEVAWALFGADALRTGKILLKDTLIEPRSPKSAVEAGLALVPEDRKARGCSSNSRFAATLRYRASIS